MLLSIIWRCPFYRGCVQNTICVQLQPLNQCNPRACALRVNKITLYSLLFMHVYAYLFACLPGPTEPTCNIQMYSLLCMHIYLHVFLVPQNPHATYKCIPYYVCRSICMSSWSHRTHMQHTNVTVHGKTWL